MTNFSFVFPGQGSQTVGMLDAWHDHPIVSQTLQEASDALHEDMAQLIHAGPKEALALTTNTQPAMLTAAIANFRVWQAEVGVLPTLLAGHSLGEYSALVAADVLSLHQAIPLVRLRAEAMQQAVPVGLGAMAAVLGLSAQQVISISQEIQRTTGATVEAVNFNEPSQTVIAGTKEGIETAAIALKEAGAKRVLPLPVSAPFHSSLMQPAAEKLRAALAQITFNLPKIPVINNIDVAQTSVAENISDALYRQAFGPVRWVETVQFMQTQGITTIVECGPGKVLTGMNKRIAPDLNCMAFYDPDTLLNTKEALA